VASKISSESNDIGNEIKLALKSQQFIGICPTCGKNMTIKKSKNGNFIGCDGYPDCVRAYPLPRGAMIQPTETICPVCGLSQLKIVRKGMPPSIQCIDPKCGSNTSKNNLGICPTCNKGTIRIMYSKTGRRFAGCSEWPNCTQTYPLRPRGVIVPTDKLCEVCNSPMILFGSITECINPDCTTKKKAKATKTVSTAEKDERVGKVVVVKKTTTTKKTVAKKKKPVKESTD
jgi:DNA topoisomerase I